MFNIKALKVVVCFDANFSCTSRSPKDQVDDLSGALHTKALLFSPRSSQQFYNF